MKDAIGQTLEVGDVVTFADQLANGVTLGRVLRFTAKYAVIRYIGVSSTRAGYNPPMVGRNKTSPYLTRVSDQMRDLDDGEIFLHFQRLRQEA